MIRISYVVVLSNNNVSDFSYVNDFQIHTNTCEKNFYMHLLPYKRIGKRTFKPRCFFIYSLYELS